METAKNNAIGSSEPTIQEYFLTQALGKTQSTNCAELHLTNLGATIMGLTLPLASGNRDVILGFARPEDYLVQDGNLGGLIGRVAGRIPAGPKGYPLVKVAGKTYPVTANSGNICLHGGEPGFHRELWELADEGQDATHNWLTFRLVSPAGDAGFPGDLEVFVTYSLETPDLAAGSADEEGCGQGKGEDKANSSPLPSPSYLDLRISYQASCSATTVCSLTQHAYFNLRGHGQGNLWGQKLQVSADHYTDFTPDLIATGEICPLEGTSLDLRQERDLGEILQPDPLLAVTRGLDHNYILSQEDHGPLQKVACLSCEDLSMEVLTTFPGLQVYTANYLDTLGKPNPAGQPTPYPPHSAVCLECQAWPNAVNLENFPSISLEPGQVYQQETVYRFRLITAEPSPTQLP